MRIALPPFFRVVMFTVLGAVLTLTGVTNAEESRRPNLVVFLADDQGWGDLSVHGNRNLATPHIDSLARDGVSLDRFYVCPVCAPTRAEFFTGRYHPRTGVRGVSTGQERLNLDERTIGDTFLAAGYATGAFGKWHNGSQWPYHPNARGFTEYYGFTSGHWGEYYDAPLERNGQSVRGEGYIADDFTTKAIDFMRRHRDRPFFCYLPFNTPHSPFCVPESYWSRFRDKKIEQLGPDGDRETLDVTRAALAMVENLDANVGRVLEQLQQWGLAENTIVVYFSDNGPNSARWNGDMKGRKGSVDEGGVRAPCFIRWPGKLPSGKRVEPICGAIDLLPTLASLAGIPRVGDKPLDGVDLAPLLRGQANTWPERSLFSHFGGRVSVRTDRYRLDQRGALFDMRTDPSQKRDISKEQPDVQQRLAAEVARWRTETLAGITDADNRPFPVGFAERPLTNLPARDGVPSGQVKRSAPAPNCSYFVHWKSLEDRLTWDIEVHTAGEYEVTIQYTCSERDVGSKIELAFQDAKLVGQVSPAWDPPLIRDQDVIPRPSAESIMKPFRPLRLGVLKLPAARGPLTMRALEIPGDQVMEVRAVELKLMRP
ncbi:MAG: arylsulfatase [Pirellulales bacterium]